MKKQKIVNNIFKYLFVVSFITFLTVYFSQSTGYYEYEQRKRKELTEEQIRQFEKDIEEGKEIDINSYLQPVSNYNNKISDASLSISDTIGNCMSKGIEFIFGGIGKLIEQ
ncbi:MAG: hypothetical protein NC181_04735 [Clostridium sp.]|nr:hypothetical protein [Clostridium sp.]MCM1444602.1 hypothetical protein [Candidatus Amulumruptor caecigallinarius]